MSIPAWGAQFLVVISMTGAGSAGPKIKRCFGRRILWKEEWCCSPELARTRGTDMGNQAGDGASFTIRFEMSGICSNRPLN